MQLTIQRSQPGAARSMDLLEHSVRTIEEFMGEPFPVRYVGILFKKAAHASEGAAGTNFGHVITQLPQYDVDDDSEYARRLPRLTAHEIAHYYWRGDERWINEGAAELLEFVVENARSDAPMAPDWPPCAYFDNLGELDRANPRHPSEGGPWGEFGCNYSLGGRFFMDLYRALGREPFQQGFRNLYLAIKGNSVYGGIAEVEAAFKKDAPPDVASAVDTVINRWYHGTEPYDLSHLGAGPVDHSLPSIKGRITDAFISLDQEWPVDVESGVDRISLEELDEIDGWAYLYLAFEFPQSVGDKVITLRYLEYYEDGFAYDSWERTHEFKAWWTARWWRFRVGRSPSYGYEWAPGRYGVMVYDGERKVAQVEYEIVP